MKGTKTDPRTISARKDLPAVLGNFFAEQLPQMGPVTREPFVKAVIALFDKYCPPTTRMKAGQVLWYAVDEKETAGYGKRTENCDLVPVTLDLFNREDKERIEIGMKRRDRSVHTAARLFNQGYEQHGVLTLQDAADIMRVSAGTMSKYVRDYEREHNEILPPSRDDPRHGANPHAQTDHLSQAYHRRQKYRADCTGSQAQPKCRHPLRQGLQARTYLLEGRNGAG